MFCVLHMLIVRTQFTQFTLGPCRPRYFNMSLLFKYLLPLPETVANYAIKVEENERGLEAHWTYIFIEVTIRNAKTEF